MTETFLLRSPFLAVSLLLPGSLPRCSGGYLPEISSPLLHVIISSPRIRTCLFSFNQASSLDRPIHTSRSGPPPNQLLLAAIIFAKVLRYERRISGDTKPPLRALTDVLSITMDFPETGLTTLPSTIPPVCQNWFFRMIPLQYISLISSASPHYFFC